MTSPTPPPGAPSAGPRRRIAVDYQQLGYGVDELPAVPTSTLPLATVTAAADPHLMMMSTPGLITHPAAAVVPPDADLEEEQWWAQGEDIPAPPLSPAHAEPLPQSIGRRQRAASAPGPVAAMLSRILGLDRLGSPRPTAAAAARRSDDGPADPPWLLDQPGTDTTATDTDDGGRQAAAGGEPVRETPPADAVAAGKPPRLGADSSRPAPADVEVSRAPRELWATLRRALVGLVLVLIAFAGVKQVIWNPIFGRSGPMSAGPAVLDQVSADAAATRYALDYLSYSPHTAAASVVAVAADVVSGGDTAPAQWAGTGYVHADTALPTGWHIVDPNRAVVAVTVRVHLAMPPAAAAGSATPQALAAAAPATVTAPAKPATPKRVVAPTHPAPAVTTAPKPTPKPVAPTEVVPAPVVSAPATVATAPVSTPPPPTGSASDPGPVPAGWTDLGSRWLTVAVPVESSGGGVKVSAAGAILTGEPAGQIGAPTNAMPDPATATATSSVATAFFTAYAQSNVAYLAQPGVNLTGLSGAASLAALSNWSVTIPTTPGSGSTPAAPSSGVGAGAVTWQLAGTDLQIQQNYAIALTSSQNRWYIAALSPAPTIQP